MNCLKYYFLHELHQNGNKKRPKKLIEIRTKITKTTNEIRQIDGWMDTKQMTKWQKHIQLLNLNQN